MGGVRIFRKVVTEMRGSLATAALAFLVLSTVTALQTKGKLTYLTLPLSASLPGTLPSTWPLTLPRFIYLKPASEQACQQTNQPPSLLACCLIYLFLIDVLVFSSFEL